MTTTFEDAKVGDRVWCLLYGWQTIECTDFNNTYRILTDKCTYTYDGKMQLDHKHRTLFWDEVVITPPTKPLPKLEADTKVIVWNNKAGKNKRKCYFSHFEKNGKIVTFSGGRTSWSKFDGETIEWEHWELAKD